MTVCTTLNITGEKVWQGSLTRWKPSVTFHDRFLHADCQGTYTEQTSKQMTHTNTSAKQNKIKHVTTTGGYSICCLYGFLSISRIPNIFRNQFTYWSLFLRKAHENYSNLKKCNSIHIQIYRYIYIYIHTSPTNSKCWFKACKYLLL